MKKIASVLTIATICASMVFAQSAKPAAPKVAQKHTMVMKKSSTTMAHHHKAPKHHKHHHHHMAKKAGAKKK